MAAMTADRRRGRLSDLRRRIGSPAWLADRTAGGVDGTARRPDRTACWVCAARWVDAAAGRFGPAARLAIAVDGWLGRTASVRRAQTGSTGPGVAPRGRACARTGRRRRSAVARFSFDEAVEALGSRVRLGFWLGRSPSPRATVTRGAGIERIALARIAAIRGRPIPRASAVPVSHVAQRNGRHSPQ
jgi:hypothetical protein